ncbi:MAG: general glycosylation protein [Gammaproteobacteria bacterium]|nr:general glycosylation protein [Gammaproteobacteria bacterium]
MICIFVGRCFDQSSLTLLVASKTPAKQRETLIKFLVIISIAVSLEALVFIFDAGKKDITNLIYPTFLLVAAVLVVVGLGAYQKLTRGKSE